MKIFVIEKEVTVNVQFNVEARNREEAIARAESWELGDWPYEELDQEGNVNRAVEV
jgi:hypothetical protein